MSETNTQAFNIKAYVNNLLSEKRELETANNALEAERTKLKQGIVKYGEIAKNLEAQNKDQQAKIQSMQRQLDTLQQENAKAAANASGANYSEEIAETLLLAQRTAKQVVNDAEQKAAVMRQDTQRALTSMYMSVSKIRDLVRRMGDDVDLVEASLESLKESGIEGKNLF